MKAKQLTEPVEVIKTWGGEEWFVNDEKYCLKRLTVVWGAYCSVHKHEIKDETFVVTNGAVLLQTFDCKGENLVKNFWLDELSDPVRIPVGCYHRFLGLSPDTAEIWETSTQHFDTDSYRVKPSGSYSAKEFFPFLKEARKNGIRL